MLNSTLNRSPELMSRGETALLVVDLQTRLLPVQMRAKEIVFNTRRLLDGAAALEVYSSATEQVPDKLGPTVDQLTERLSGRILTKKAFSSAQSEALLDEYRQRGIRHIVLAGIETHVCIEQTALDLVAFGFEPKIAVDAVGSRFLVDHEVALRRLEAAGVILTTTEAILFEWCETSEDAAFRTISTLAKETLAEEPSNEG